jgi:hypothetical protein
MTATQQKIELMQIANMDDLNAEIARVKSRITMHQEVLKLKMKQLPKEALKYGAIAIIPKIIAARISKRGFGVASSLLGWLFNKKEDKKTEAKNAALKAAKQVGVYTGLGLLFKKLKDKL